MFSSAFSYVFILQIFYENVHQLFVSVALLEVNKVLHSTLFFCCCSNLDQLGFLLANSNTMANSSFQEFANVELHVAANPSHSCFMLDTAYATICTSDEVLIELLSHLLKSCLDGDSYLFPPEEGLMGLGIIFLNAIRDFFYSERKGIKFACLYAEES